MGALGNLIPLVILFLVVGGMGWVGYQMYLYSNELANRGVKQMEKKNVVFNKDGGVRVGVKEINPEEYADRTQRAFVKTWNTAQESTGVKSTHSGSRTSSFPKKSSTS